MKTPILLLSLRCKRDILVARQRARQVAALLGLEARDQTLLAAAVFEMASHAAAQFRRAEIRFALDGDSFQISTAPERRATKPMKDAAAGHDSVVRIAKKLTGPSSDVAREDLAWIVEELGNLTPSNLFHEIKQQNQELLRSLHELQQCQEELAGLQGQRRSHRAA